MELIMNLHSRWKAFVIKLSTTFKEVSIDFGKATLTRRVGDGTGIALFKDFLFFAKFAPLAISYNTHGINRETLNPSPHGFVKNYSTLLSSFQPKHGSPTMMMYIK